MWYYYGKNREKIMKKITLIICLYLLCSCDKEAEKSSYLSIQNFSFENSEGETKADDESTNITDAWVTINGTFIGAFETPSNIPILNLEEKDNDIRISPGIKENGISGSRMIYPFYNTYNFITEAINHGETQIINPETSYKEVNFKFLTQGTFELGNMLEQTENSDTIPFIQNEEVFQGEKSCALCIDNINDSFQVITIDNFYFNDFPEYVFLEMNFKSSVNFRVGLIKNNDLQNKAEHMQIYKSENWKKIYINLSQLIIPNITNSTFQIYFESDMLDNNSGGCVYLDNIKVVY